MYNQIIVKYSAKTFFTFFHFKYLLNDMKALINCDFKTPTFLHSNNNFFIEYLKSNQYNYIIVTLTSSLQAQ